jgi:hypothetical protein
MQEDILRIFRDSMKIVISLFYSYEHEEEEEDDEKYSA